MRFALIVLCYFMLSGCSMWIPDRESREDAVYAQKRAYCYSGARTKEDLDHCAAQVDAEHHRNIVRSRP